MIRVFSGALSRSWLRALTARDGPSRWTPLDRPPRSPVEQAVRALRRLARPGRSCVGAEWWFNTRGGRPFHYDKDEALFRRTHRMVHPLRASILYLSDGGGPTFVLNETRETLRRGRRDRTIRGFRIAPRANRFVVFPGDRFHAAAFGRRVSLAINWWDRRPEGVKEAAAGRLLPASTSRPRRVHPAPLRMTPFKGGLYVIEGTPGATARRIGE